MRLDPLAGALFAAGGLTDIDFVLTVATIVLFLIFALVLAKFAWGPLLHMIEEREKGIDGARKEAETMSSEADARLSDYESKLSEARSRAYDEQRKLRTEAAAYQAEVTDKARTEANQAIEGGR